MSNQLRQKILVFVQSQVQSIIRRVRTAPFAMPQNGEPSTSANAVSVSHLFTSPLHPSRSNNDFYLNNSE